MTEKSLTTAAPASFMAKLQLVQAKLEQAHEQQKTIFNDVLGFIAYHRRVDETQTSPQAYRLIAINLSQLTGVDVTHEAIRRWHRDVERILADRERDLARTSSIASA